MSIQYVVQHVNENVIVDMLMQHIDMFALHVDKDGNVLTQHTNMLM